MRVAEGLLLAVGGGCYTIGAAAAWARQRTAVAWWILLGAAVFGGAIAVRWVAYGQGPFLTLYEILVSSLFSLGLVYGAAVLYRPQVLCGAPVATALLVLMVAWLAATDPHSTPLPATYGNPWLWVHVAMGKLFLGCCLVASSLAAAAWLRLDQPHRGPARADPSVWRWLAAAFVCHSAMLLAGAVWALDAWGRYWGWDPLETWAFATWLAMAFSLHARTTLDLSPTTQHALIVGIFVLAFLTFFGVPFVSLAPHKGAV